MNAHDQSVGVFVRGLTNLEGQLAKAEVHAAAIGCDEETFLNARIASGGPRPGDAAHAPRDVHMYSLADHVHWAAEGARLAIARILGVPAVPEASGAESFAALRERMDATIAHLRKTAASDVESGLDRTIVVEHPRGAIRASGSQFLLAMAIPHFFYHLTTAYGILRNQGVQVTMADFLGDWATN